MQRKKKKNQRRKKTPSPPHGYMALVSSMSCTSYSYIKIDYGN